ncbi:transposase [Cupriavidus sp. SK-3]|nr:transposase [Cupriavidus sp. SK-3]
MPAGSHRLSILTQHEIDELYGLPRFTDEDRQAYFDLSEPERWAVHSRTTSVAVHLALQLGYFKAKRQFFDYDQYAIHDDLHHVLRRHFPTKDVSAINMPSYPTRRALQHTVLELLGFRLCDSSAKDELEHRAQRIAMLSTQPIYILRETLQYLNQQRIVAPIYTFLQDMVGRVVTGERKRITQLLADALTPDITGQLDALLQAGESAYRISVLKREPKDFSYKELRQEVERRQFFAPLHAFARHFLETAGISTESGRYYASLVKFYTVYKLQRMPAATTRLYLLCFAYYRFRQINDNLIEAVIHLVDQYEKWARAAAEEAMQRALTDASTHLQAAGKVLNLFVDDSIPGNASFASVKKKAFSLLEPERFALVSNYMRNVAFDRAGFEWSHYTTLSPTIKRNLRHLFSELDFAGRVEDAPLLDGIVFLQALLRNRKSPRQTSPSTFPMDLIPKSLQRYLYASEPGKRKRLDVDRYEFLIYRLLRNALEAGDVFGEHSTEFRRFEDDLISDVRWQHKDTVLKDIGAPVLLNPIEQTLTAFHEAIEAKLKLVNQRIESGDNQHIKVSRRNDQRRWALLYPDADETVNGSFYAQLPGIGIADLLWFVAGRTGFLRAFTHVLDRYVKHDAEPREILACIVAMGTNMGLRKMAEVSRLSHTSMATTARNYLRLETLHAANDAISNATASLPAFHLFDIRDEVHSSSDGQRFETQIDTFNARHSPKYFGLQKGVSACTLVANHVPVNATIIGTHEHESHYVFDLLYNNTSDIQPERHSTDTHGTNQVNFWILHAFGYQFAPRYRDLHKKTGGLIGFHHPSRYEDWLIRPSRKARDDLIVREWPNIQRIMASLAQKDVTQATIVRKLSSYTRQNQTKKALWELDNLCRTLYILEFIDDVGLRQSVQKALNRGEAYHRLRRAVAYVNSGKFRVQTEAEQQIWNECSRLIANAIIHYNVALLSRVYEQKRAAGDHDAMELIRGLSPVAWQHVNLFGSFEFSPANSPVDIDALAAYYADPAYWGKIQRAASEPAEA